MDRGKLFEDNQGLVFAVLKKLRPTLPKEFTRNNWDDLTQEGLLGLWQAAERFDENKGIQFSTFATNYIEGTVKMYLDKEFRPRRKTEQPTFVSLESERCEGATLAEIVAAPETEDVTWILESSRLNDFQRTVARMTYEGYTQKEIGEALGKAQRTISYTLKRIGEILNE